MQKFAALLAHFLILILSINLINSVNSIVSPVLAQNSITVKMTENGFDPQNIQINVGDTIVFENADQNPHWPASDIHPTHQIYPGFDPKKPVSPGQDWQFKFDVAGTFKFHDHLNPDLNGSISVLEGGQSQTQNTPSKWKNMFQNFASLKIKLAKIFSLLTHLKKDENKASSISTLPENYDKDSIYGSLKADCKAEDIRCISQILKDITAKNGPQAAIDVLTSLQKDQLVADNIDDHQLAHEIGRQTAKTYGYNGQSFLLCPMSAYNGGCQHGFFENALGQSANSKEAIDLVCGTLGDSYSSKFRFYCYHGVGHGVLMAQAYDLGASLDICDSLSESFGQNGCWQGVFMENVNTGMRHEAKEGIFSQTDPLAPCNVVEDKYRHECFINHAGWLVQYFKMDISLASKACLEAPANNINACLQSLGLMTTNPVWQINLAGNSQPNDSTAWQICLKFPKSHQDQCVIGAIDNLMNFNELKVDEAQKFCNSIASNFKDLCYRMVGANLRNQSTDGDIVKNLCEQIDNKNFKIQCLIGAGVNSD